MATPQSDYMLLKGGTDNGSSTIYTSDDTNTQNLIKVGDTIKITGTASNNGVYTVSGIQTDGTALGTAGDVYYILKGKRLTAENSNSGRALRIEVIRPTGDKLCTSPEARTNGGGISVWSTNATTDYTTRHNGWSDDVINPTITGIGAKYIYLFIDNALRVCNINEQHESLIKWYGYIQRDQFAASGVNSGKSPTFAEWQEHPNTLAPPKMSGQFTLAFGQSRNDDTSANPWSDDTVANYYKNDRGVRLTKKTSTSDLRVKGDLDAAATAFTFEDTNPTDILDQSTTGEVITIDDAINAVPTEYLFCKKTSGSSGGTITYSRAYGGKLSGTAPVDLANEATPIIERGVGWNISVADGTDDGQWLPDTYEFYQTFIYDGNQESLPVLMGEGSSTIAKFTHTTVGGKSLRVGVFADFAYNGRISGGRVYIRPQGSDGELTLLLDIDIVLGVRTSLSGDYEIWVYDDAIGYYVIPDESSATGVGNCKFPNLDTYTTINGFSHQSKFISIGKLGEMYKDSVVANRRAFIVNVKTSGYTGELEKYGDRLMYSEINRFDTFLEDNFIDVSKGDYGEYVAIKTFADRLIAFKHNLVHIINIASPNPASWYLEETLRYGGINYNYSATNTKYGVAWVSDTGCYLYDGSKIRNLIDRKLGINEVTNAEADTGTIFKWSDFVNGSANVKDPMIGYEPMSDSLVIVRSPNDNTTNSNNGYVYDFNTNAWCHLGNLIPDNEQISNFFHDWNNNLCTLFDTNANVNDFKKFLPVPLATGGGTDGSSNEYINQKIYTRDIDFGDPSTVKKVYAVTITYKAPSVGQASPLKYAVGGKQPAAFTSFATKTLSATNDWDIATFTASTPISCNTIQFLIELPSSGVFELNEMSIEYRIIRGKTTADG